jgi:catechol 2,3-dioxygenase-like lactoylglutathione lyase family enzyme
MDPTPRMRISGVVLDSPDAQELAAFYQRLLGWAKVQDEPDWVKLDPPDGGTPLSFQSEPAYVRPSWPSDTDHQQMMVHLDIEVDDLDAACAHARAVGATLAGFQPQQQVRVHLDPAGHPFCLWVR